MPDNPLLNRKTQRIILILSIAVILLGLFELVFGSPNHLLETNNIGNNPPTSKDGPFIILILLAIILAFFSARNLLKNNK